MGRSVIQVIFSFVQRLAKAMEPNNPVGHPSHPPSTIHGHSQCIQDIPVFPRPLIRMEFSLNL